MIKQKTTILKSLGQISIVIGVLGIVSQILVLLSERLSFMGYFIVTGLQDYTNLFFGPFKNAFNISIITTLFLLFMIIGGVIYNKSKGKNSNILRFSYSIIAINGFFRIIQIPFHYLFLQKMIKSNVTIKGDVPNIYHYILPVLPYTVIIIIAFLITKWLIQEHIFHNNKTMELISVKVKYTKLASSNKRFFHLIFDFILMIMIVLPFLITIYNLFNYTHYSIENLILNKLLLSAYLFIGLIIYYLTFEGLFNATPIKFLSGTKIVDKETLRNPGFAKIVLRTISRHIPFEPFSFLGKEGWHDSLSGTVVIEEDSNNRNYHLWWGVFVFTIYFGLIGFIKAKQSYINDKKEEFKRQVSISQTEAIVNNLYIGDVITGKMAPNNYKTPITALIINGTDHSEARDDIIAQRVKLNKSVKINRSTLLSDEKNIIEVIDTVKFSKTNILKSYINKKKSPIVLADSLDFYIMEIFDLNHPKFSKTSYTQKGDNGVGYSFKFDLCPIKVISIKAIEGYVNWTDDFPLEPVFKERNKQGYFTISGTIAKNKRYFKAELIIAYKGRESSYILEGFDTNAKIYRKKSIVKDVGDIKE